MRQDKIRGVLESIQKVGNKEILAKLLTWAESVTSDGVQRKATKEVINGIYWVGVEKIKNEIELALREEKESVEKTTVQEALS